MSFEPNRDCGAVILAAGASLRMGQSKLLLPWGRGTVLAHLVSSWRRLGVGQLAVVCAPGAHELTQELDRIGFAAANRIVNPRPEEGMFSSIRAAAVWSGWSEPWPRVAVVLGDQPQVSAGTLQRILAFAAAHPIGVIQPSHRGRRRHPVLLPWAHFKALPETRVGTLKEYLDGHSDSIRCCDLDDPALDVDLDTPADYAAALAMFPPAET